MTDSVTPVPSPIITRLTEPSTWAGLSAMALTGSVQVPAPYHAWVLIAAGVCAGLAVVMRERGTKTPEQIAADALTAARDVAAAK